MANSPSSTAYSPSTGVPHLFLLMARLLCSPAWWAPACLAPLDGPWAQQGGTGPPHFQSRPWGPACLSEPLLGSWHCLHQQCWRVLSCDLLYFGFVSFRRFILCLILHLTWHHSLTSFLSWLGPPLRLAGVLISCTRTCSLHPTSPTLPSWSPRISHTVAGPAAPWLGLWVAGGRGGRLARGWACVVGWSASGPAPQG